MKAIVVTQPGGPDVLQLQNVADPVIGSDEVLIRIIAAGINRADTVQRQGFYPPPKGASTYPGLECSGIIEAVGDLVRDWKIGDQVCALLGGGGYAERVSVAATQLLPIPRGVTLRDAASLPEVACTVWSTVFMTCHLSPGESFLIHGGSSGIGTFAIQLAKSLGVKVLVTAGSNEKLKVCQELGADVIINYKEEDFVEKVKSATSGKGVNVILDIMGASYFQKNLDALATDGRLFLLGFQGGPSGQFDLRPIMAKRLTVTGAGLRSRSTESKGEIVSQVIANVWPLIEEGKVKPIIYKVLSLEEASVAHEIMESSQHIGKILLLTGN